MIPRQVRMCAACARGCRAFRRLCYAGLARSWSSPPSSPDKRPKLRAWHASVGAASRRNARPPFVGCW